MTDDQRKATPLPAGVLLEQVVEDDDGNMHIVPEELLLGRQPGGEALLRENGLAVENMENDWPCTDVMGEERTARREDD